MLSCPAAEFSGFVLTESGRSVGYFLMAQLGRQARLVDFQITGQQDSAERFRALRSLFSAVTRTASQDKKIAELVVGTSDDKIGGMLVEIGFRLRRQDEILYYDPRKLLEAGTQLNLNLIDSDLSFLYNPARPYIS